MNKEYNFMSLLSVDLLDSFFNKEKETALFGRWIRLADITPVILKHEKNTSVKQIGISEQQRPIYSIQLGTGKKKILVWTQMHGNESTGTKALFDFFNCAKEPSETIFTTILKECTFFCIPMLNPDGSLNYTRVNANQIDLNRDAVDQKAVESKLLRNVIETFKPDYSFNLHDQRTIFGVEGTKNPATISFLAPSEEVTRKVTDGRKLTMNVIVAMNALLQKIIPNHVGRYTDEFYPTATGDNFQKLGFNTILIEAGHFPGDYEREEVRKFNFFALVQGIYHIATTTNYKEYLPYFDIPNNQKNFFDVIVAKEKGYVYVDKVIDNTFTTELKLEKEGGLESYLAHSVKSYFS